MADNVSFGAIMFPTYISPYEYNEETKLPIDELLNKLNEGVEPQAAQSKLEIKMLSR